MNKTTELVLNFLLNAAWQIAVVALVATICARLLRNVAPRFRHALWVAALLLSLLLPLWSLLDLSGDGSRRIAEPSTRALQVSLNLNGPPSSSPAPKIADAAEGSGLNLDRLLQRHRQTMPITKGWSLALAMAYALFLLYRLGTLWRAWRRTQRLRRSSYECEIPARLAAVAERCREAFGLRSVRLKCSTMTTAPITIGTREPVIIAPESFYSERSEETLSSVLGHEMAHVARRDFALNLVYEFLRLPISFHPLANFIKRQIDRTRELACDDLVTERVLEPKAYARSLVRVASTLVKTADQAFTLGVFDADILEERIMKLTRKTRKLGARAARLLALNAFSLLCLACMAVSTFSLNLRMDGANARASAVAVKEDANEASETISTEHHYAASAQGEQSNAASATSAEGAQDLSSPNAQERAAAACSAGRKRALDTIPTLIAMLGDDTPTQPLKCWDNGRWNPALESFKQPSPGEEAAIALASMGTPALEPLTNALANSNGSVRRNAAWAIGELTNMLEDERANAVPPLISLLRDGDEWVRMAAARALGEIKDKRAAENLTASLLDSQWRVREMAAWALGEMKEESAVETLCNVLVSDAQAEVRMTAAWALGEIQSRKAVSFLKQALSDPEPRVRDKARWALSEIEDS